MVLSAFQFQVTDNAGNVQPEASIEVRRESDNGLATLFSDREGAVPLANPFDADEDGYALFFSAGGAKKITASLGGFSRVWRYVPMGLLQEQDSLSQGWRFHSIQDMTGLTEHDFAPLPANVATIKLIFDIVSQDGTSDIGVQLGVAAGFENTGYSSISANTNSGAPTVGATSEFVIDGDVAASNMHGVFILSKASPSVNVWVNDHRMMRSSVAIVGCGRKTLADVLTSVKVKSLSAEFDSGNISLWYDLDGVI